MNSRDVIRHPGLEAKSRIASARGEVTRRSVHLKAGQILMDAVAQVMDDAKCDSGVIVLDGIDVGPFDYVMPSYSNDGIHAAWYSETHSCKAARLDHATAIVGRRADAWWLHCHTRWQSDRGVGMGHLLPDTVVISTDAVVTLYAFEGGSFDVGFDPETAFPLFHVQGEGRSYGNALIAKVCPHEDLYTSVQALISEAGFSQATVFGIGSLIGASFEDGTPMQCPISEILIAPNAQWDGSLELPIHCVDTDFNLFYGNVVSGQAPVLVTFELMIIETAGNPL